MQLIPGVSKTLVSAGLNPFQEVIWATERLKTSGLASYLILHIQ